MKIVKKWMNIPIKVLKNVWICNYYINKILKKTCLETKVNFKRNKLFSYFGDYSN